MKTISSGISKCMRDEGGSASTKAVRASDERVGHGMGDEAAEKWWC